MTSRSHYVANKKVHKENDYANGQWMYRHGFWDMCLKGIIYTVDMYVEKTADMIEH